MFSYTADSLLALRHDTPPARSVRKILFSTHLWSPGGERQHVNEVIRLLVNERLQTQRNRNLRVGWLNVQSLGNKTTAVHELIEEKELNVLALTEVWHRSSEDLMLKLAAPSNYLVVDAVRESSPGHGGIAVFYDATIRCQRVELPSFSSFEALCVRFSAGGSVWLLLTIYRPGSTAVGQLFLNELGSVLETLAVENVPIVIGGDMNIHVENQSATVVQDYIDLLQSMDLHQHVVGPTHKSGGTLDHVITQSEYNITSLKVAIPDLISCHSLITCCLPAALPGALPVATVVRSWRSVDKAALIQAITESPLGSVPDDNVTVDELYKMYNSTLREIADMFAPERTVQVRTRPMSPWFDAECRAARRQCRHAERRFRRTRTDDDKNVYIEACKKKHETLEEKRNQYWTDRVTSERTAPAKLWRTLSRVLQRDARLAEKIAETHNTADDFSRFFNRKVADVRADTEGRTCPQSALTATTELSTLRPLTMNEVRRLITQSPTKSCNIDPIPTWLLKDLIDALLPFITAMVNSSLIQGRFPSAEKHAVVTPLLKKQGMNVDELKNYRPVSNLSFISKITEKAAMKQVVDYLEVNSLLPRCQSAYRRNHCTETALLKVGTEILQCIDSRQISALGLLDLSAAFDCIDHDILLGRLQDRFGIRGSVVGWVGSYLQGRTQQVVYRGHLSKVSELQFGVPQGSVCGPILFLLYTAEVFDLVHSLGLEVDGYADDLQVRCSGPAHQQAALVSRLTAGIVAIREWFADNRLRLNEDKTQVIWLGTRQQLTKIDTTHLVLPNATVPFSPSVKNLGVTFDRCLTMKEHVSSLSKSCLFQLRQLRTIRRSLTPDAAKTLAQAFICSRLDYCNSLFAGISKRLLQRLQAVQNATARMVTGARKFDHISPVIRELHWLPVRQRIAFKLALLAYKAQRSMVPGYLADMCVPTSSCSRRRNLRSERANMLNVPMTKTAYGERGFNSSGPRTWNSLPANLRDPGVSLEAFRKGLKTYLFSSSDH